MIIHSPIKDFIMHQILRKKTIIAIFIYATFFLMSGQYISAQVSKSSEQGVTSETGKIGDEVKTDIPESKIIKKEEPRKKNAKGKKPDFFTLNFKDVEISEFVNMMGQMIGKNVVLDENVRGKITINSAKKIPVSEAFNVMKSILEVKGLAVVETPNFIKILPIRDAARKNIDIIVDGTNVSDIDSTKMITYLLELQNADATQITQVLQPLKSQMTDIVVYNVLNTIIFSGPSSEIEGLVKIARALDRSPVKGGPDVKSSKGNIHVVQLRYANAEELANVLSRVPFSEIAFLNTDDPSVRQSAAAQRATGGAGQPQQQQQKSKLSIIASKEANALIITATPNEFNEIKNLIAQLDIVREQVLIEALIVEVNADNSWGFGIDWMIGGKQNSQMFGTSQIFNPNNLNYKNTTGIDKTLALPLNQGFQLGFLSDTSILSFALLNASETDSKFNVLSTPQILTIDNQEAELNVGEQIPIQTQNTTGSTGTTQYSYEYKSVGVKLKITPHITNDEQISLDLYQEVNQVSGDYQTIGTTIVPPKIQKRDIKTKVTVFNGKTVVVGGLISNSKTVSEYKVPILGDIPLIGWLFKRKTESYSKKNLLVFITPHLVTKFEKLDAITRQKKDEQKMLRGE
jgi:general secretion pathway protein D